MNERTNHKPQTIGELEPANRGPRGRAPARRLHRPLGAVLPKRARDHGAHQVVIDDDEGLMSLCMYVCKGTWAFIWVGTSRSSVEEADKWKVKEPPSRVFTWGRTKA